MGRGPWLERGGPRAGVDSLNDVEQTGLPFPGALQGRGRGYGGTGETWAGQCRPFDSPDLEPRSWVPASGWPILSAELGGWVDKASQFFALDGMT